MSENKKMQPEEGKKIPDDAEGVQVAERVEQSPPGSTEGVWSVPSKCLAWNTLDD